MEAPLYIYLHNFQLLSPSRLHTAYTAYANPNSNPNVNMNTNGNGKAKANVASELIHGLISANANANMNTIELTMNFEFRL